MSHKGFFYGINLKKVGLKSQDFNDIEAPEVSFASLIEKK